MKLRKAVVLMMVLAMLSVIFAGCSKSSNESTSGDGATPTVKTEEPKTDDPKTDEVVTLKWLMVGNGMPTN
ncbi:MAG: hypothetical protein K0S61_2708, partial [Anaerocolumna sp.]|nr:hypothetical protein [Anaerocolumna sp.]